MKVKAVETGYWGGVLRPQGAIFEFTGSKEEMGTWMVPVSKADAKGAPHAPGMNRPLTQAEAGVPVGAVIETAEDDPNLVNLEDIGAQAAPAAPTGVSAEEREKSADKAAAREERAAKEADKKA